MGARCHFAHGKEELRSLSDVTIKKHFISIIIFDILIKFVKSIK